MCHRAKELQYMYCKTGLATVGVKALGCGYRIYSAIRQGFPSIE